MNQSLNENNLNHSSGLQLLLRGREGGREGEREGGKERRRKEGRRAGKERV